METSDVIKPYLLSVLRRALQGVGLYLVHQGYVSDGQWGELLTGLAGILAVEGWLFWSKLQTKWKINAANALPPGASNSQIEAKATQMKAEAQ